MVSEFGNLEKVVYQSAHYRAGFGFVVVRKGQFLQVSEQFVTHIGLYSYADHVPPVSDYVVHNRFQKEYPQQHARTNQHVAKACRVYHFACDFGVNEITDRHDERAKQIDKEKF